MVVGKRSVWAAALVVGALLLGSSGVCAQAQEPAADTPDRSPDAAPPHPGDEQSAGDDPPGDEQPPAAQPPTGLQPPRLTKFVEATYPPEAFEQGLSARVVIEVVIGADGTIQEASVVEPVGHGFDEAALQAVRQFEFAPATRDGEPIPARIHYPYVFQPREVEAEAPQDEAPPPARLVGTIRRGEDDVPLGGAEITIESEDGGESYRQVTDAGGTFDFKDLTPGRWTVNLMREGREPRLLKEELIAGQISQVVYRLEEPEDPEAFGAVARIPPPPREVTRRTIGKEQLTRIPGTRGDALRTVELMPGVARPPLGAGALIVRGSNPADSQALFEGIPVQLLYHFGGLTSVINSRMIESIDFYPGNFSVRYGRRRGGIVEVRAAELPRDELVGVADLNLIDASLLVQAPISDDAEIAVAGRRSYFDLVFESALESADVSTLAAPVYYDYQVMGTYRPTDRDKLRVMAYGSSDELRLLFDEPQDTDSAVSGNFDFGTEFHRGQFSWRRQLSDRVDQDIEVAVGQVDVDFGLGDAFDFNLSGVDIYTRAEWRGRVTDEVRLIGGLDLFFFPGDFTYSGPPVQSSEGQPENNQGGSALSNRDAITATDAFTLVQPAVYLETDLNLYPFTVVLGSRIDYFDEIREYTFDPRVAAQAMVTETTKVKGGIGMFAQPPEFPESSPALGNPDLEATKTLHTTLGVEQNVTDDISASVEGFYKHTFDGVVGTQFGEPPRFVNDGQARVYGAEFSGMVNPTGRFFGYLSYTLSRSERRDRPGERWRLFDFDQTHIFTLSAVYRLGRGWELGGTFRLVSGNPNTPIVGANLNTVTGLYSPVFGRTNSIRNPTFNRLDVRLEKQWDFDVWKLAFYIDVQNSYNAENPQGKVYDYEYRRSQNIRGLPIIPVLGLRGEI
ncbi:MAG: TonB family protein [Myxococcales bacterium]|jgi:TonB family protein